MPNRVSRSIMTVWVIKNRHISRIVYINTIQGQPSTYLITHQLKCTSFKTNGNNTPHRWFHLINIFFCIRSFVVGKYFDVPIVLICPLNWLRSKNHSELHIHLYTKYNKFVITSIYI